MPLSVFVYDDVWYNDKLKAYKYRRSNDQSDGDSVDNPSFECPGPDWVWAGRAKFNAPDHIIFETASKIDDRIQQRHSLTGWRMVQVVMAMNWVRIPSPETNTAIQEDGDNAKGVEKEENQDESEEEGVVEEEVKTIVQTLQRVWKILSFLRRPKRRWNEVEEEVFRRFMIAYRENESSPEENVQENTVQENTVQENTVQEETAQESSNVEEDAVTFAEVFHKLDLLMKPWNPAKFAFEVGLKTARRLIGRYLLVSRRTLENDQEEARDRRLEKQEKTIQGNYLHTSGTTRTTKLTSWWQAIRWNEPDIGNICSDAPKTLAPEGSVIKVVLGIANPEVGQEQSSNLQPVDSNLSTLREVENEHTVEICEMEAELDQSRPVEMVDEGSDTSSDNENERVTHPSETGVAEHDTITVTSGEHDESYGLQSIVGLSDNDSITFDGIAASEEPRLEVTIMKVTVIEVDDDSDCDTIGEDEHKVRDHSQSPSSLKSLRSPDRDQAVQENFEKDEIEKAAHKVFEKYKTLERHENEWKLHELPEFECQIRQTTTNFGLYWLGQGAVFPKLNDQSKHKEIASGDDKSYTESIPGDTDVEYWTLYTSPEDEDEWRARTSTPKSPEPQTCDKLTLIPELEEQDLDGWNFRVSQSLNNRDVVEPEVKDGGIPPNRTPENMAAKFREDFAAVMEEFDPDELEFESDQLYFETQPVERISESVDKPAVVNLEEKSSGVSSNRTQEQMATKFRDDFAAIMEEFDEDELDFEYQPPEGVHELERVSARAEARYADDGGTGNLLLLDFGIQNSAWDANIDPPPYSNEEDIEENSVPNPQWSEGLWDNWDEMEEARFHDELETREAGFILDQELYEHVIPQLGGNMTHFGGIKLYDGPADEEPLPAHESDELSEESDDSTETIKPSHFAGHDDSTDAPRSDSVHYIEDVKSEDPNERADESEDDNTQINTQQPQISPTSSPTVGELTERPERPEDTSTASSTDVQARFCFLNTSAQPKSSFPITSLVKRLLDGETVPQQTHRPRPTTGLARSSRTPSESEPKMNNFPSFLDTSGNGVGGNPPRQTPSPGPGQHQANGIGSAMNFLNGAGVSSAAAQMDLNYVMQMVQQLADINAENRAEQNRIVNGITQLQQSHTYDSLSPNGGPVNGDAHAAARYAEITTELTVVTNKLHNAERMAEESKLEVDVMKEIKEEYDKTIQHLMNKLRPYAYSHTQATIALHKHYQALLDAERQANLDLRLEHQQWQTGLARVAEYARLALGAQSDASLSYVTRIRELKQENKVLRKLAGWEPAEDSDNEEESVQKGEAQHRPQQ